MVPFLRSYHICWSHITSTTHRRPTTVSHDHCYYEAANSDAAGVVAIETGSSSPEVSQSSPETKMSEVKDNRRCLFCSVEGDASCMVSWPHPLTTPLPKSMVQYAYTSAYTSAFCNFYRLGVPEQALSGIPLTVGDCCGR